MLPRTLLFALLVTAACKSAPAQPAPPPPASAQTPKDAPKDAQKAAIRVTKDGFEPTEVKLAQGKPAVLEFTRVADSDCLKAVRMPWLEDAVPLPLNQPVIIPVDTQTAGSVRYSCWMGMVFGRITIAP